MKVFVAGATGVLGRRAVPLLVQAGHEVTGVARSEEKAALLRRLGAQPVSVDLFDASAVKAGVAGHEVVVNVATKIPPPAQAMRSGAWRENARIRTEASRNLVEAALDAGAGRFVQESIAFIYRDGGDAWIDEDVPLEPPAVGSPSVEAEGQARRFTESGGTGVVLRFGQFYAADATHSAYMCRMARLRLPALPGPHGAYSPPVAAADAAAGVLASLAAPAGTYNVSDDEPLTRRAFNRALADALGVKPPLVTGSLLLRLNGNARLYLRSQRISNRRFKEATGWAPRYPEARSGLQAMVADMAR